jgi:hypothetical protein
MSIEAIKTKRSAMSKLLDKDSYKAPGVVPFPVLVRSVLPAVGITTGGYARLARSLDDEGEGANRTSVLCVLKVLQSTLDQKSHHRISIPICALA